MYSKDLESRILQLAIERGLLANASQEDLDAAPLLDLEALQHSSQFGPRLDRLVGKGFFDRSAVEALVWEVILGVQTPSGLPSTKESARPEWSGQLPDPSLSGRFLDLQLLGEGANAKVYKAFDPHLQRWVALKFLKTTDPGHREILLAEARTQAKIEHPNICRVHEVGEMGEQGYIVMELARGATLAHALDSLDLTAKIRIIQDVAEGIHAAHRQGLVHLDLKPGNILLQPKGDGTYRPLITDFGMVVSEGRKGEGLPGPMGTPPYASPEQISGRPDLLDRRSDIYSLGVVLYVTLCGRLPFDANDFPELLEAIQNRKPVPLRARDPDLSEDLEAIIETCLAKAPPRRYPSALALADDLQRHLSNEPVHAIASSRTYRLRKWIRRNRLLSSVLMAAVLLCTGLVTAGLGAIYRIKKQARLVKAFQGEVDQMEIILRSSHRMPTHVITPEVEKVRAHMERVRSLMSNEGSLAEGPGHYALGRAYLMLGDLETAREHCQRAWDAGFRLPEEAAALGECLGQLYQIKLSEYILITATTVFEPFGDLQVPASTRRLLEQKYREPSKAYLNLGLASQSPEQRLCLDGLIALQEGRPESALEAVRESARLAPWHLEAALLEAEAYRFLATPNLHASSPEEVDSALERMHAAILRARDLARSSPAVCGAETHYRYLRLYHKVLRHQVTEQDFRDVIEATEGNLAMDPGSWTAHADQAWVLCLWGEYLLGQGRDPRPYLDQAIAAGKRAERLNPDSPWILIALGFSLHIRAESGRRFFGEDCRPLVERALRLFERALPRTPFPDIVNMWVGSSHLFMGLHEIQTGLDGAASMAQAISHYRRTLELAPNSVAYHNMASAYKWLGMQAQWQDQDPLPAYGQSIEAYRQSLKLFPVAHQSWARLGDLLVLRGNWKLHANQDPTSDIHEALEAAGKCIALKPDYHLGHTNRGEALVLQSRWSSEHGLDPSDTLRQAQEALDEAIRLFPKHPDILKDQGTLYLEQVRWALRARKPFESSLAQGMKKADASFHQNASYIPGRLLKAELLLLASMDPGPRASRRRQEAILILDHCRVLNPRLGAEISRFLAEYPAVLRY